MPTSTILFKLQGSGFCSGAALGSVFATSSGTYKQNDSSLLFGGLLALPSRILQASNGLGI